MECVECRREHRLGAADKTRGGGTRLSVPRVESACAESAYADSACAESAYTDSACAMSQAAGVRLSACAVLSYR